MCACVLLFVRAVRRCGVLVPAATAASAAAAAPPTWCAAEEPSTAAGAGRAGGVRTAVVEPWTGKQFDVVRREDGGALLGATVRCMMGLCRLSIARGYAYAIYVAPEAVVRADGDLQALLAAKAADPAGVGVLSVRLVIARDVEGDHMANGFDKSFTRRLRRVVDGPSAELLASVHSVIRPFRGVKFFEGDRVDFVWRTDGGLDVLHNGRSMCATVACPELAHAVLLTYSELNADGKRQFDDNLSVMHALAKGGDASPDKLASVVLPMGASLSE